MLFHEFNGLFHPFVRQVLVTKPRFMSSGVKTDPANPVVYGRIVTMRPVHLQCIPMCLSSGVIRAGCFSSNPEWIQRIKAHHSMILDVDLRYSVVSSRQ